MIPPDPPRYDCHAHVIDPARFPLVPSAGYQPTAEEAGPREAWLATLDANGMAGGLLVQPSGYGFDNRALLDAIAAAPHRLRGIAVVPSDIGDAELDALGERGVVGVRYNLISADPGALAAASASGLLARLAARGWWAQVLLPPSGRAPLVDALLDCGVKVVIDHMGLQESTLDPTDPEFRQVLRLAETGRAAAKLSGYFRLSRQGPPYADLRPAADALLEAFGPERCVFGSDWPFINAGGQRPRYEDLLAGLVTLVPDPGHRRTVLHEAPQLLFGLGRTTE